MAASGDTPGPGPEAKAGAVRTNDITKAASSKFNFFTSLSPAEDYTAHCARLMTAALGRP